MARPRVFISSTFFDLRQVRDDIGRFIRELGYEPVLFERGDVPYGSKDGLDEYCYREIERCDILVSIVGGRYGSIAPNSTYSVSQRELRNAIERGKQVYVFVEKGVHAEFQTYKVNKGIEGIRYFHVDDVRVYEFLEEVYALPHNNPVFVFSTATDITTILKEQWAGLFQRLLQEEAIRPQADLLTDLRNTVVALQQTVQLLKQNGDSDAMLLLEHPAYARVRSLLRTSIRTVFLNVDELDKLLRACHYSPVDEQAWDQPNVREWYKDLPGNKYALFKVSNQLFDESGRLRLISQQDWSDGWITREVRDKDQDVQPPDDDDIPF